MRKSLVTAAMAVVCVAGLSGNALGATNQHEIKKILLKVEHTHTFQVESGHPLTHFWGAANKCHHKGCKRLNKVRLTRWTQRALRARAQLSPWPAYWIGEAACVHSHEGAWNDATGNGYFGGMQMDSTFEQSYGPTFYARWGNANNWPVPSQLIASFKAWLSRGWEPWPNTSAMCGL